VSAAVEATTVQTLYSRARPVDTAVSGDGKMFFVLTDKESVEVYDARGVLQGIVGLEGGADTIEASAAGDIIYLTDTSSRETRFVAVDLIKKIDTAGSPFKGPADAPVVVAVFSDFQ